MDTKHIVVMVVIVVVTLGCSRRSGLEVAGSSVASKPNSPFTQPSDFDLGDNTGQRVPFPERSQPATRQPVSDPFQNDFLGGQDPWSLLDSFLPPYRPAADSSESRAVLTAGRYKITPNASTTGGFYRLGIVSPVFLFVDGAQCSGALAGPIFPGVSICLDIQETKTPMPVPIRLTIQGQNGSKSHTLWVLILPGEVQAEIKVASQIPPIVVSEQFGRDGIRQNYQVQPSVFTVELQNVRSVDEFEVMANDPLTRITRQGSQFSVVTTKRGELVITAQRRGSGVAGGAIKVYVPLDYSMQSTNKSGNPLYSNNRFRVSCIYNGPPSQSELREANGFAYLLPLQTGMVTSSLMERHVTNKLAKVQLKIPGNAGSFSCRGQLLERNRPDARVFMELNLDVR